jgi:brefeldin A-inhibited guanine nucleotide-exchange protein
LNGKAMLDFARALCEMSWDEIISSSSREHPRMYSLQKLLEICHYNITTRIRIEWTQVWGVIGSHINQVGCHSNPNVVYFCIDKLRQLATKFLDIVELPNFKFQKDFMRPFLFIFENNPDVKIKDMVLTCVNQMILHKSSKLVSGWKALFSILSAAALEPTGNLLWLI